MKFCGAGKLKQNNIEMLCFLIIFLITFVGTRKFDFTNAEKISGVY